MLRRDSQGTSAVLEICILMHECSFLRSRFSGPTDLDVFDIHQLKHTFFKGNRLQTCPDFDNMVCLIRGVRAEHPEDLKEGIGSLGRP